MSKFWDHYARMNDDVRAKLIDEAWFERRTGDTPFQNDVAATRSQAGYDTHDAPQYAAVYGTDPHLPEALDGIGARGSDDMNADSTKEAVHDFYGYDSRDADDLSERANDLYGYDALDDIEPDEPER